MGMQQSVFGERVRYFRMPLPEYQPEFKHLGEVFSDHYELVSDSDVFSIDFPDECIDACFSDVYPIDVPDHLIRAGYPSLDVRVVPLEYLH